MSHDSSIGPKAFFYPNPNNLITFFVLLATLHCFCFCVIPATPTQLHCSHFIVIAPASALLTLLQQGLVAFELPSCRHRVVFTLSLLLSRRRPRTLVLVVVLVFVVVALLLLCRLVAFILLLLPKLVLHF
ncbi:hypothetical protein PIB30_062346 [Stylosanthes scabra]|uniref:Transmembrane protein n=1 Tax=Stylosanthes scabra TaxID=79078 RepID=A0ABU6XLA8_9FABA|nr:hypothetical protein [Stylosanthes scabra]